MYTQLYCVEVSLNYICYTHTSNLRIYVTHARLCLYTLALLLVYYTYYHYM